MSIRNALAYFSGKVGSILVALAAAPIAISYLGLHDYGRVIALFSLAGLLKCFDLGLSGLAARFASEISDAQDSDIFRCKLLDVERAYLVVGICCGVLIALVASVGAAALFHLEIEFSFAAACALGIWIAASWQSSIYLSALVGAGKPTDAALHQCAFDLLKWGAVCSAGFITEWGGAGYFLYLALFSLLASAEARWYFWRKVRRPVVRHRHSLFKDRSARDVMLGLSVVAGFGQITQNGDRLLLGALAGPAAVAAYGVAATYASSVVFANGMLGELYFRKLAAAHKNGSAAITSCFERFLLFALIVGGGIAIAMGLISADLMHLWLGAKLPEGAVQVARLLLVVGALSGLSNCFDLLQLASYDLKFSRTFRIVWVLLFFPIGLLFVKTLGVSGMAWTWLLLYASYFVLAWLILRPRHLLL